MKKLANTRYVLVIKDKLEFLNNETPEATQEEHSKWFHDFWWEQPKSIIFFDTKEKAIEYGLRTSDIYWWIIYDSDGKAVDGAY